jgi:hypothetical protein
MEEIKMLIKVWSENQNGRYQVEDLCLYERIILEWILRKQGGRVFSIFMWLRIEAGGGLL